MLEKLKFFLSNFKCEFDSCGFYPPWEFVENSELLNDYCCVFEEKFGYKPNVEAIHAGLECGVFSSQIKDLECIAIGPDIYDVHTVNERLDIASVDKIFDLIVEILSKKQLL